jgi:hypothetical protein
MTKDLFDKAEEYFTDNLLDFFEIGKEEKIYPYNELVMDNFTIQRVIYSSQYGYTDIKREIGEHMSDEEIEAGALPINELIRYFKKWISHKGVGGKSKYPDVTAAWTS